MEEKPIVTLLINRLLFILPLNDEIQVRFWPPYITEMSDLLYRMCKHAFSTVVHGQTKDHVNILPIAISWETKIDSTWSIDINIMVNML